MERIRKPANELEGVIRDRLRDRHGDGPNWIGMPIWESDPDKDDKRNFIAIMQGVRRDYDLLTNH